MLNLNSENIMKVFWENVAGHTKVVTGRREYIRTLNYITDEKEEIVNPDIPILNLKGARLPAFKQALTEYVQTFFSSELNWANPLSSCFSNEEKLLHAISAIWLNATPDDFDNPIEFLKRYTNFLKDKTFNEFWGGKQIDKVQTLSNSTLTIIKADQTEFQETPTAIRFKVQKGDVVKELPRIAYGISEGVAYIYGIQAPDRDESAEKTPEVKKINRSRYKLNDMNNIPVDYQESYLRQEPYAYLSLFTFLSMLKQAGINKVVMQAYLPERVASKEMFLEDRIEYELAHEAPGRKERLRELYARQGDYKRVQYNITNKFLQYMSRMECDVPGIEITATPEQTNGSLVADISKMNLTNYENIIFYEVYKKLEELMKTRDKKEEETR